MNEVILDGVKYVKASVAAKQFRYTSDYIGQLCRAQKIEAKLVGRSWFVSLESLRDHKKNRHTEKNKLPRDYSDTAIKIKTSHIDVVSVIRNKTVKNVLSKQKISVENKTIKLKIAYESDDENLIPELKIKHHITPKSIKVELGDSKNIRVKGREVEADFTTTPIPEVSLSGKLNLTSYPDLKEDKLLLKDSEAVITDPELDKKVEITPDFKIKKFSAIKVKTPVSNASTSDEKISLTMTSKLPSEMFVPEIAVSFSPQSINKKKKKQISLLVLISPLLATILALVFLFLIISLVSTTVVSEDSSVTKIDIQLENIWVLFNTD